MRCSAYCTAESYNLFLIADYYKKQNYTTKFYRDVLYVIHPEKNGEIFLFLIGCYVSWGLSSREERAMVKQLNKFATNPLEVIEIDRFIFNYGEKTSLHSHDRFNADVITLEDEDVQIKTAISYGLAQSVKLESYEESVQKTIKINRTLPHELAVKGRISLSRKAISQRIGEIFLERSSVNLSSEYLDMPEYFWQLPRLEIYYAMTEKFLDLPRRVTSLNQRLDVLHGLLEMMNNQLQNRHSTILEFIIISLILIEIILSLVQLHF